MMGNELKVADLYVQHHEAEWRAFHRLRVAQRAKANGPWPEKEPRPRFVTLPGAAVWVDYGHSADRRTPEDLME